MRRIGIVTTSRADYSSLRPVMQAIVGDPKLTLLLFVGGAHLADEFGRTVVEIESDGFPVAARLDLMPAADTPEATAAVVGRGMIAFAESLRTHRPDILVLAGDRYELLSAAGAALPFGVPLAHIGGGDLTYGAFDNQVRYALTTLSHVHFVALEAHAVRLRQMGEDPDRVFVTGDPALDVLDDLVPLTRDELSNRLAFDFKPPLVVVNFHPTTRSRTPVDAQTESLLTALDGIRATFVFTYPNADPGYRGVIDRIRVFAAIHPNAAVRSSLGSEAYYSLLAAADVMVGNSSSGIWEAPSFRLPVVNVGERQDGRLRAGNVIDVGFDSSKIVEAINRALTPGFRASLVGLLNPYAGRRATARIVEVLGRIPMGHDLLVKPFVGIRAPVGCCR